MTQRVDTADSSEVTQAVPVAPDALPQWVPHAGKVGTALHQRTRQLWLTLECTFLFVLLPLLLTFGVIPGRGLRLLGFITLGVVLLLFLDRRFRFRDFFQPLRRSDFWRVLMRGVPIGLGVFLLAWLGDRFQWWPHLSLLWESRPDRFADELFMSFIKARPDIWILVMCLYPIFSALPQEIVWRTFFFHRYKEIFPTQTAMIWASTLTFAFLHVIFQNAVSLACCLVGGYLFSITYARTRSLTAVWLEHSVYGCLIFTSGLGFFFFFTAARAG